MSLLLSNKTSAGNQAKIRAWRQQHTAIGAERYRVTLRGRRAWLPDGKNPGKGRGPDGSERFWTPDDVEAMIPGLAKSNAAGFDIYITPIDPDRYWLVLDDSDKDRLADLRQALGWTPALVQETSKHDDGRPNLQAIFIATQRPGDRRAANALIVEANQRYGDKSFTGAVHPFRLAGFANKKGGKGSPFTRIIDTGSPDPDPATDRWLQERLAASPTPDPATPPDPGLSPTGRYSVTTSDATTDANARWLDHAHERVRWEKRQGRDLDFSKIDYLASRNLAREGFGRVQVSAALLFGSNKIRATYGGRPLRDQHPDAERYADAKARDAVARARGQLSAFAFLPFCLCASRARGGAHLTSSQGPVRRFTVYPDSPTPRLKLDSLIRGSTHNPTTPPRPSPARGAARRRVARGFILSLRSA